MRWQRYRYAVPLAIKKVKSQALNPGIFSRFWKKGGW
jgi:hypothetical protein